MHTHTHTRSLFLSLCLSLSPNPFLRARPARLLERRTWKGELYPTLLQRPLGVQWKAAPHPMASCTRRLCRIQCLLKAPLVWCRRTKLTWSTARYMTTILRLASIWQAPTPGGGRPLSKKDQHPPEQASPYIFSHMAPAPAALGVDIERLEGAADMVSDVAGQVSLSYLLSEHVSFYVSSCVSLYTCFYGP